MSYPFCLFEVNHLDDVGDLSKAPITNRKGHNVNLYTEDLDERITLKENLLNLSRVISREWTEAAEEHNNYIKLYPGPRYISCRIRGCTLQMVLYDLRVGLNILSE